MLQQTRGGDRPWPDCAGGAAAQGIVPGGKVPKGPSIPPVNHFKPRAVTVPHREHCQGKLVKVDPGKLFFAGQGNATHFAKYSITGSNNFDDKGSITNGQFTSTVADGSTISGIYSGTYVALPNGKVRFDVNVLWLKGTGRLAGVTGQASTVAILDSVSLGAAFTYLTNGTLTFPRP